MLQSSSQIENFVNTSKRNVKKVKLNFSRSALFYTNTKVCIIHCGQDYSFGNNRDRIDFLVSPFNITRSMLRFIFIMGNCRQIGGIYSKGINYFD